jgi:hypothetical protein
MEELTRYNRNSNDLITKSELLLDYIYDLITIQSINLLIDKRNKKKAKNERANVHYEQHFLRECKMITKYN